MTSALANQWLVPPRFARCVEMHVLNNVVATHGFDPPLMLGIHGRPGDGKSWQVRQVLQNRLGIEVEEFGAIHTESPDSNEPVRLLIQHLLVCGQRNLEVVAGHRQRQDYRVLLADDADLLIGRRHNLVQQTQNLDLLTQLLMRVADHPTEIVDLDYSRHLIARVPIIITANDLGRVYGPLTRHGRMHAFHWAPSAAERLRIADNILGPLGLKPKDVKRLIETLDKRSGKGPVSIATIAMLRNYLVGDLMARQLYSNSEAELMERALELGKSGWSLSNIPMKALPGAIDEAIEAVLNEMDRTNHLEEAVEVRA